MSKEAQSKPEARKRYPLNVPGPFFVEQDYCLICCVPESIAPDLIGFYEDGTGSHAKSHCYFKKQPETPEELDRAIEAMKHACCGAYNYEGDDPEIIRRLGDRINR